MKKSILNLSFFLSFFTAFAQTNGLVAYSPLNNNGTSETEYNETVNDATLRIDNLEKPKFTNSLNREKPVPPKPTNLIFNTNSFMLQKDANTLMTNFCKDLIIYLSSKENNIKDIYISTHTQFAISDNSNEDVNRKKEMLAILSANRAQMVVETIKNQLVAVGVDIGILQNITFHVYPTSYKMIQEKSVYITFEETKHMKEAKIYFNELAIEYNIIPKNNIGGMDNLLTYLVNKPLQGICLDDIKDTINLLNSGKEVEDYRNVPLEYYYDNLDGYNSFFKSTNERNDIKKKLTNKISNWGNGRFSLVDFVLIPE